MHLGALLIAVGRQYQFIWIDPMPPSDKKMKSLYPPTARGQEQKIIQEVAQR